MKLPVSWEKPLVLIDQGMSKATASAVSGTKESWSRKDASMKPRGSTVAGFLRFTSTRIRPSVVVLAQVTVPGSPKASPSSLPLGE